MRHDDDSILFFMNIPSHHQDSHFEAIANEFHGAFLAAYYSMNNETRRELGWIDRMGNYNYELVPSNIFKRILWYKRFIRNFRFIAISSLSINIFGRQARRSWEALIFALIYKKYILVLTEPSEDWKWKKKNLSSGIKNRIRKSIFSVFKNRISGILAISDRARQEFKYYGFPDNKIFPYGYFVVNKCYASERPSSCKSLLYVGRLIELKGIMDLLSAFQKIKYMYPDINIKIAGFGPLSDKIMKMVDEHIHLLGPMASNKIPLLMASSRCVIVPSQIDGWGVAVNESIQQCTPVICSSNVGSKELVEASNCGLVYEQGNEKELIRCLSEIIFDDEGIELMSKNAQAYRYKINPRVAANYLYKICLYLTGAINNKPKVPWLSI